MSQPCDPIYESVSLIQKCYNEVRHEYVCLSKTTQRMRHKVKLFTPNNITTVSLVSQSIKSFLYRTDKMHRQMYEGRKAGTHKHIDKIEGRQVRGRWPDLKWVAPKITWRVISFFLVYSELSGSFLYMPSSSQSTQPRRSTCRI